MISPADAARWTGGTWTRLPDAPLAGVSTDSRSVTPGSLFVALRGERFDGHAFVAKALASGAAAAMVAHAEAPAQKESHAEFAESAESSGAEASVGNPSHPCHPCETIAPKAGAAASVVHPLLLVPDPNRALSDLARGWRLASSATVVGVTGSAGKTTVKEMTATLLATLGETAKTPGNFNNDVGLPLSLLAMPETARFGVFEAGISHPGEMVPLADIMRPRVAVVSCIAPVHLAAFPAGLAAIADEKAGLLRALPPDGLAVLPLDDAQFPLLRAAAPCRVVTASLSNPEADFFAEDVDAARGAFTACERPAPRPEARAPRPEARALSRVRIETGMPGEHNVRNALLAIAVARSLGAEWPAIAEAFAAVRRPPMRWQVSDLGGATLVNDAYNANPLSMAKALETFAAIPVAGRRYAVLGDMLELGEADEAELHRGVGRAAAGAGLDELWLVGERAGRWIREGALAAGMAAAHVTACATTEEAAERAHVFLRPGDALLLKASRGLRLEGVEQRLRALPFRCDAVELRGLRAECVLGILPEERGVRRPVEIDLRLEGDFSRAAETDDIADAVDYRVVAERVLDAVRASEDGLLERLARRAAEAALAEPGVRRAVARVVKPAPMPGLAASVAVFAAKDPETDA